MESLADAELVLVSAVNRSDVLLTSAERVSETSQSHVVERLLDGGGWELHDGVEAREHCSSPEDVSPGATTTFEQLLAVVEAECSALTWESGVEGLVGGTGITKSRGSE